MSDIGKINLNNLSDGLYKEALKLSKENKLEQNIEKLINIASKDGFTADEKKFLEGLASTDNVLKLKDSKQTSKSLEFVEPGFKKSIDFINGFKENTTEVKIKLSILNQENIDKLSKGIDKELVSQIKNTFPSSHEQKQIFDIINIDKSIDISQIKPLLNSGILKSKDKDGKSILDNLHDMAFVTPQKISDHKQLVKDAIKLLQPGNDGRKNITQGNIHFTCGAASIEQFMKKFEPAELIRIVKDLARNGETTLKGGNKIQAATDSLKFRAGHEIKATSEELTKYGDGKKVLEDRSAFDIIFQSTVMKNIALIGGDMTGQNTSILSDLWIANKTNAIDLDYNLESDSEYSSIERGNRGGHPGAISNFLSQVTGKNYDYKHSLTLKGMVGDFWSKIADPAAKSYLNLKDKEQNNDILINQLKKSLSKGKDTIFVYGKSLESLHYVTGVKFGEQNGKQGVFVVNTMLADNKMGIKNKEKGSQTEYFISLEDLKQKLQGVIFEK